MLKRPTNGVVAFTNDNDLFKPILSRRAISASSLTTATQEPSRQTVIGGLKEKDMNVVIIDALRDHTRDKFRALIKSLKGIMNGSDH